ncbi:MAG: RNA polymerase sigma factor [Planctomycetes bacterium]|nr:RNA polymerase sigma factor [Planctomycetota bacterium]
MESEELEKDLVEKAQANDRSAFDRLARESRSRLAAFVCSRLGEELRSRHEVEDVVQETFLRAYRSIGRFQWQGEGSFLRWATSIADLLIRDLARAAARPVNSPVDLTRDLPSNEPPPERGLRREERFDRFERAYHTLSPEHQEVIRLARLEGLKVSEVAERLGRSQSAVRHLLLRALEKLRAAFGEETASLHLPPRRMDVRLGDGEAECRDPDQGGRHDSA